MRAPHIRNLVAAASRPLALAGLLSMVWCLPGISTLNLLGTAVAAPCDTALYSGFTAIEGLTYAITKLEYPHAEAQQVARASGGKLANLNTKSRHVGVATTFFQQLGPKGAAWIGITDTTRDQRFCREGDTGCTPHPERFTWDDVSGSGGTIHKLTAVAEGGDTANCGADAITCITGNCSADAIEGGVSDGQPVGRASGCKGNKAVTIGYYLVQPEEPYSAWSAGQPDNHCSVDDMSVAGGNGCFGEYWGALNKEGEWVDVGDHGDYTQNSAGPVPTTLKALVVFPEVLDCAQQGNGDSGIFVGEDGQRTNRAAYAVPTCTKAPPADLAQNNDVSYTAEERELLNNPSRDPQRAAELMTRGEIVVVPESLPCLPTTTKEWFCPIEQQQCAPGCATGATFDAVNSRCIVAKGAVDDPCPEGSTVVDDYSCAVPPGPVCPLDSAYPCRAIDSGLNDGTQFCSPPRQCLTAPTEETNDSTMGAADVRNDGGITDQGVCAGTWYIFNGEDSRCTKSDSRGMITSIAKIIAIIALSMTGVGAVLGAYAVGGSAAAAAVGATAGSAAAAGALTGVAATAATAIGSFAISAAVTVAADAATGNLGASTAMAVGMAAVTSFASAGSEIMSTYGDSISKAYQGSALQSFVTDSGIGSGLSSFYSGSGLKTVVDGVSGAYGSASTWVSNTYDQAAAGLATAKDNILNSVGLGDIGQACVDPTVGLSNTYSSLDISSGSGLAGMAGGTSSAGTDLLSSLTGSTTQQAAEKGLWDSAWDSVKSGASEASGQLGSYYDKVDQAMNGGLSRLKDVAPQMATSSMFSSYTPTRCCYPDKLSAGCFKDDDSQSKTWVKAKKKQCVEVGSYCFKKWAGACVARKLTSCCFDSMLARMIVEQGRKQISDFLDADGNVYWGTPKDPFCQGFTLEQFSLLDFGKIDFGEYIDVMQLPDVEQVTGNLKSSGSSAMSQINVTPNPGLVPTPATQETQQ